MIGMNNDEIKEELREKGIKNTRAKKSFAAFTEKC